jgi:hypothetical protein
MATIGVRVVHEPYGPAKADAPAIPKRVILSNMSRARAPTGATAANTGTVKIAESCRPLAAADCNGIVLEMSTWKPLAIPPKQFITSIDIDATNVLLAQGALDLFEIEDGTTITLYHYPAAGDNPWRIATNNGIDVGNVRWNTKTYRDVLHETLQYCAIDPDAFYAGLDPSTAYTLGFKHPDFHPFVKNDAERFKIWAIQSVKLETWDCSHEAFGGLKTQVALPPITNVRILFRKLTNAYRDFLDRGHVDFGYILRPRTGQQAMLLESSLLRNIRHMHYARSIAREATTMKYERVKYLVLRSYLSQTNRDFIVLFPCYSAEYDELDGIVRTLAEAVLPGTKPAALSAKFTPAIERISADMRKMVSAKTVLSSAMIVSFIKSNAYLDLLYKLWTTS